VSTPCTEASDPVVPADNERNKKRKALQEELTAIELEQKRVRVAKELADLDNEDWEFLQGISLGSSIPAAYNRYQNWVTQFKPFCAINHSDQRNEE
jgi:hypothetical protein